MCNRSVSRASGVVLQCNAVASQGGNEGTAVEGMVFRLTDTQLGALDQVQQKGYVKYAPRPSSKRGGCGCLMLRASVVLCVSQFMLVLVPSCIMMQPGRWHV